MAEYTVEASRVIAAPAERVYGIVADYRAGHPRILPPAYFGGLWVEEGGVGAGTRIRFTMKVMGKEYEMRALVSEPEPGRVLVETDVDGLLATAFKADPIDADHTRMTFSTTGRTRAGGLMGHIERFFTLRFLPKVYAEELALLAKVAEG